MILIKSLLCSVMSSVKLRRYFDIYISPRRVRGLQLSTKLTKYLRTILNTCSYCEDYLTWNIIVPRLTLDCISKKKYLAFCLSPLTLCAGRSRHL